MKKAAVISNTTRDKDYESLKSVASIIKNNNISLLLPKEYMPSGIDAEYTTVEQMKQVDMVIVLGGDGTLLGAARNFFGEDIPLLGINHGRLGFLTEIERNDKKSLEQILKGDYITANHMTLSVKTEGKSFVALNDATLHRGPLSRMLNISVYIEGQIVNAFRADGVIVATPTGSTAYSLSAGGPIVDPTVNVMIVTPICPHDLYSRSIIVPADKEIIIKVSNDDSDETVLTMDGQICENVSNNKEIKISGNGSIKLVRKSNSSFYDKIQKKMFEKEI